ncbi:MAG: hypothetical protein V4582_15700 [Pseudomonadota bacterium]
MNEEPSNAAPRFRPCPWEALLTAQDVEAWIEAHNRSLQEHVRPHESGYGVCFTLGEGGNIYLQTSADGAVVLDVDADAQWVAPLIVAATGAPTPTGSLWLLPDDRLIQLIIGLSSLIATSTLVVGHAFGLRQRKLPLPRR